MRPDSMVFFLFFSALPSEGIKKSTARQQAANALLEEECPAIIAAPTLAVSRAPTPEAGANRDATSAETGGLNNSLRHGGWQQ